jgi:hypothetical protein
MRDRLAQRSGFELSVPLVWRETARIGRGGPDHDPFSTFSTNLETIAVKVSLQFNLFPEFRVLDGLVGCFSRPSFDF